MFRSRQDSEHRVVSANDLQQQLYAWQTTEDLFGGVSDTAAREQLHKMLFDSFAPSVPSSERSFAHLQDFLDEANRAITGGRSEWTLSHDPAYEDAEDSFRFNPLLALQMHLSWLARIFTGYPGLSIIVQ